MAAELALEAEILETSPKAQRKVLPGGWLLSPKVPQAYRHRYITFVLPEIYPNEQELSTAIKTWEDRVGWHTCATFLTEASFGVMVVGAVSSHGVLNHQLEWRSFVYQNETLTSVTPAPFTRWPGGRGRASPGSLWSDEVLARYDSIPLPTLTALTLRQAFFYSYLKQELRLPLYDPYDVDGFIISHAGSIIPVEVKEKSRTPKGEFGLDVGRILMLLRLGLSTDSNAFYLIREVAEGMGRPLMGWKYASLSDILMSAQWNAQSGGASMTGGGTQTVMMDAGIFRDFTDNTLSEENLKVESTLSTAVQQKMREFRANLNDYF